MKFRKCERQEKQKEEGRQRVSIKDIINNINVRLGFMVHSWKSFLFSSILKLWEIFRKIIFNYGKNLEKKKGNDMVANVT